MGLGACLTVVFSLVVMAHDLLDLSMMNREGATRPESDAEMGAVRAGKGRRRRRRGAGSVPQSRPPERFFAWKGRRSLLRGLHVLVCRERSGDDRREGEQAPAPLPDDGCWREERGHCWRRG